MTPKPEPKAEQLPTSSPMAQAVRTTLARLEVDPSTDARAALAITLAKVLDADAGMAVAAVSRELRATLSELEAATAGEPDDAFATLIAELSAPLGDA